MEQFANNILFYFLLALPVALFGSLMFYAPYFKGRTKKKKVPIATTPIVEERETLKKETEKDPILSAAKLLKNGELDEAEAVLLLVLDTAAESSELRTKCEARYYLAKVNFAMGDLTLACEHWQIARDLYQELGDSARTKEIDKYMKENGCPTEWVLNAF